MNNCTQKLVLHYPILYVKIKKKCLRNTKMEWSESKTVFDPLLESKTSATQLIRKKSFKGITANSLENKFKKSQKNASRFFRKLSINKVFVKEFYHLVEYVLFYIYLIYFILFFAKIKLFIFATLS